MDTLTEHILTSREDLAARFDPPTERLRTKALDHVNAAGRNFIARSPFPSAISRRSSPRSGSGLPRCSVCSH